MYYQFAYRLFSYFLRKRLNRFKNNISISTDWHNVSAVLLWCWLIRCLCYICTMWKVISSCSNIRCWSHKKASAGFIFCSAVTGQECWLKQVRAPFTIFYFKFKLIIVTSSYHKPKVQIVFYIDYKHLKNCLIFALQVKIPVYCIL